MKPKIITSLLVASVVFLSTSFIIREREENLNPAFNLYQEDQCFAKFLSNLKKMEAVIYIPEGKVQQARSFPFATYNARKAEKINREFVGELGNYQMAVPVENPDNPCSESVNLTFSDLNMKVFVRKNQVNYMRDELSFKFLINLINSRVR